MAADGAGAGPVSAGPVSAGPVSAGPVDAAEAAAPVQLAPGVLAAFTGRPGGTSQPPYASLNLSGAVGDDPAAVAGNRLAVARACGLEVSRLVWMRQVHGSRVGYAAAPAARGPGADLDAIFTDVPGLALGVLAADCAPVLLADPAARIVGAAHSGRAGTAAGVVPALVDAMRGAGA